MTGKWGQSQVGAEKRVSKAFIICRVQQVKYIGSIFMQKTETYKQLSFRIQNLEFFFFLIYGQGIQENYKGSRR